jgi:serine/threonine-protein kinase
MITEGDHGRRVRVLDFGIAKIVRGEEPAGSGRTRTGSVPAFSPAYAAPEQVTFSRTGPWTDVHALGLILSELLTGARPFADPEASVHEQVMAAVRPTPASKGRDVGAFEAVIARALALAPGDRHRNAGELLAALEEAAGGGSAAAALPPPPAPAPQALRKRTKTIAALGVLAAAGAVAAADLALRPVRAPAPATTNVPTPTAGAAPAPAPPPAAPIAPVVPAPAAEKPAPPRAPTPPGRHRKPAATRPASPSSPPAPAKRVDLFDDTK